MEKQNKIVLVTGGSRGLGKNAAIHLAKKGLNVILTYQSKKEDADETVEEIQKIGVNAAALQLNVADTKSFDGFINEVKAVLKSQFEANKVDYLVNNAGIGIHASFEETTEEQFDTLLNIQFKGVFFLTQKVLAIMNDGGGIVNVSTGLARFALPGYAAYASMKGAMETLTKYQAKELGARGINVNIVAPGAIETDFGGGVVRDNEQMNKGIASQTALGRVGLPDDIGPVVAFLCTEESKWINAQRIEASGGMFL
ncbi:SDR family NAD(P)-dependent oxidoreductase [Pedobacter aquatilis]|uniref:SDR family NAD(P)-dependent oxidoreductase n=1 Tax=Pedobacter aquatilis TaxID=351343 RepID=UPI0029317758|nr:SDR family oxidoreductase [Pedobacter aquatilis]